MKLSGSQIAGGNPVHARVENDFYATNPKAVKMLLDAYPLTIKEFLEPCVGQGHIVKAVEEWCAERGYTINATCIDIVDRGYVGVQQQDFLTWESEQKYDTIITNPPYSLAREFAEKGLSLLKDAGTMALFLKIQWLEGGERSGREKFFAETPPKYVYVFKHRMATWNNGEEINLETQKMWATTFTHAWFVWEKGWNGEPKIRWL